VDVRLAPTEAERRLRSNETIRKSTGIFVSMGPAKHENVAIFRRKMSGEHKNPAYTGWALSFVCYVFFCKKGITPSKLHTEIHHLFVFRLLLRT
jgi:hypothetical protein